MQLLKKLVLIVAAFWVGIFFVTFFTADDLSITERIVCSGAFAAVVGVFGLIGLFVPSNKSGKVVNKSQNSRSKNNVIYIFEGDFGKNPVYRIEGNKIFEKMNSKPKYEIKGNKIYPIFGNRWLFRIENNRVYREFNTRAEYRVEGNKIYQGEFGRVAKYRIDKRF